MPKPQSTRAILFIGLSLIVVGGGMLVAASKSGWDIERFLWDLQRLLTPKTQTLTQRSGGAYPPSPVISGIELDWSTQRSEAPGSGDWGITWADDDHQYALWGNGGGFGGTNKDGRVYLGIVRIEGDKSDYQGYNVWGGKEPENPAQFGGKAYSMISIDGTLYMWRCGDTDGVSAYDFQQLYQSTDHSKTWTFTGVEFTQESFPGDDRGFFCPIFLQFGKDYHGARDDFVYIYAPEIKSTKWGVNKPGEMTLMRVPKSGLSDRIQYEFFAGFDANQNALWTGDVMERFPAFDSGDLGVLHPSASYNPGLDRYFIFVEHTAAAGGNISLYDAPEPWGPWTTVLFDDEFGVPFISDTTFMWVMPNKWLSPEGHEFVITFTGKGRFDAWNTIEGRFLLNNSP